MLGGFKWHSNGGGGGRGAGGRPRDPGLPWVPLYCQRDTQKPSHALSPSPGPHALHVLLELQGSALVFGLELDLENTLLFFWHPFKHKHPY